MILAQALSTITDSRGQIQVAEWRPNSLTDEIRDALRNLPITDETGPSIDANWGEESLSPAERTFGWNSFAILAMQSGAPVVLPTRHKYKHENVMIDADLVATIIK